MVQPQIDGLEILGLVGEGSCGSVFIARDQAGEWCAVRVFNALAVNRSLIEAIVKRLNAGTFPDGAIPVVWRESQQGSKCLIMPMLAKVDEANGTIEPRTLQETMGEFPEKDPWELIEKIARALASMHQRRIPHGNLKPGNVFFDDSGDVKLADFAMGHMPGVGMLPYTDALLYAPPEQLREPDGYTSGKGYVWDTYAFAVMAFRLLTGKFPRCEATFSKVAPGPGESHVTGIQTDVIKLAERLEHRELENWPEETSDPRERKRREVIQRCLSLNPEDRCADLTEVLKAWDDIDDNAKVADEKASLTKRLSLTKLGMFAALGLAIAGAIGCIVLSGLLTMEKASRRSDVAVLNKEIITLTERRNRAIATQNAALKKKETAEGREAKIRDQLLALGVANDHILAWALKDKSGDFPELGKSFSSHEILLNDLRHFLKLTDGEAQFQPIRTRIQTQLAELELHGKNTAAADKLLDQAVAGWKPDGQAANLSSPAASTRYTHNYRVARARLIALLQSLDKGDAVMTQKLLPKARRAIASITKADPTEQRRINAVMQIIDGQLIKESNPAKALEHFQLAIKDLEGIRDALPTNVSIRSELAQYTLLSTSLAETLDRVDDAARLRGEAASHLHWLLEKDPNNKLAKTKLASYQLLAAEGELRAGQDSAGAKKLAAAEKLLSGLSPTDTTPDGAAMQFAIAKGLRAVIHRDRGRLTEAAKQLDEAIRITDKIVTANPSASEPLYRLAAFHWQRAGLAGDAGDVENELSLGARSADLMQSLLKLGAGKRDTELRRSLAYLYGDLAHTAATRGKRKDASEYYKNAAAIWQSLIEKNGKQAEYTEGLQWCRARQSSL
ncbi:MAG: protein kinase domain-containing protein [Akkermansiaceae bacterium]